MTGRFTRFNLIRMKKFDFKTETYQIIGLCMEVHNYLGYGFSEIVYKDAIEVEAINRGILIFREKEYDICYKEKMLKHRFRADMVLFENIIVEVKSSGKGMADEHIAQTLNYMKVSGCNVGLIVNFGKQSLEYKRLVV
jgi:GxxExxY protein